MFENVQNASIAVASEEDILAAMGQAKPEDKKDKGKTESKEKSNEGKSDNSKEKSAKSTKEKAEPESKKTIKEASKKDLDIAAGEEDDNDVNDDDVNDDDNEDDKNDTNDSVDDKDNDKDSEKDDKDDKDEDEPIGVTDFLKARVNLLIKKGEWLDFEGREDVEWDEDTFAEIELKQREAQRDQMREELLDEFGPYGRAIAEYSANGGDAEELIDIFKEQKRVESLSIESEDSQKDVVYKYATEYQKMKPERAKKYVDGLIADKELEDAAKEAKESMEKSLKAQEKALIEEQEEEKKAEKAKVKQGLDKFAKDVNTVLNLRNDIPADEKRDLLKVLTTYKNLQNGTPVNDFYFKFAEFRKDLPNYIELVRLVLNPKKYLKTVKNTGKSETTEKDFSLIRTGNKTKKTKSSSAPSEKGEKKSTFKLLY